jgi:hypothetical protein
MNTLNFETGRAIPSELENVIEPLAGYICAADHPRAALSLALSALRHQVEQMNKVARTHVARRRATSISRN